MVGGLGDGPGRHVVEEGDVWLLQESEGREWRGGNRYRLLRHIEGKINFYNIEITSTF